MLPIRLSRTGLTFRKRLYTEPLKKSEISISSWGKIHVYSDRNQPTRDFPPDSGRRSFTLSVDFPPSSYGVAHRRVYRVSTCELFTKSLPSARKHGGQNLLPRQKVFPFVFARDPAAPNLGLRTSWSFLVGRSCLKVLSVLRGTSNAQAPPPPPPGPL